MLGSEFVKGLSEKKQQKYANANMQLHMVALWAQVGDDKPARK